MKKSAKTIAIAATFAVAMGLTSCVPPTGTFNKSDVDDGSHYKPDDDDVPCVYGPPDDYDPYYDDVQTEYEAPYFDEYDPSNDDVEDVYGPPPDDFIEED